MKTVKLSDFQIIPLTASVHREDISDEEYFSSKYSDCLSNSRIKLINPDEGGRPAKYLENPHFSSSSLNVGSAVHELFLQPDEFTLGPACNKPTATKGMVVEKAKQYRLAGESIYDSIAKAIKDCDYYKGVVTDARVSDILRSGLDYYLKTKNITDPNIILLDDKSRETVIDCVNSLSNNRFIMKKVRPSDDGLFGSDVYSFNEDAFFMNYCVVYKNEKSTVIKYKMKADNWTIDLDNKVLTLNDLKTNGGFIGGFMSESGHMYTYHYYRQMAWYGDVLKEYAKREYGYDDADWSFRANMLVVSTIKDHESRCFNVNHSQLIAGKEEYEKLLKMVAYYEMFGYDEEVEFI